MLCTCYRDDMPYKDPHTAAPALWALRHRDHVDFEVSVCATEGTKAERLALEAVAISLHRNEHQRSPLVNFAGQVTGYRLSSGNTAHLVNTGRGFRGGPDPIAASSPSGGIQGSLYHPVTAADWLGLPWSSWLPVDSASIEAGRGVYRIRRSSMPDLVYVGQGKVADRITAHRAKAKPPDHPQAVHFTGDLEVAWVDLEIDTRLLLEIENDAIASHWLSHRSAPSAQFIG